MGNKQSSSTTKTRLAEKREPDKKKNSETQNISKSSIWIFYPPSI